MRRDCTYRITGIVLGLLLIAGAVPWSGCAKKAAEAPRADAAKGGMMVQAPTEEGEAAYDYAAPTAAPGEEMQGMMKASGPMPGGGGAPTRAPEARLDPNAYVSNTYQGGSGSRERLAKLVEEGVMVDGKRVKLTAFTSQYSQPFKIPTKAALNLEASTERTKVLTQGGKTYLQVGIQAINKEAPKRPDLNICLVIDRSGSMSGEKIDQARAAAVEVVGRLAKTDTVAIVAYDDRAEVMAAAQKATNKDALRAKLQQIGPGGSTDIHSGLKMGYGEIEKHLDPKAINEVILLSDGEVTAGVDDLGEFARLTSQWFDKGVQTTTVGMGLEYDEELMMTVAREGKGNYHFVRDAASIQDIFEEELEDLTHVVAKALRLRIELAKGVQCVRALGSAQLEDDQVAATKRTERIQDERIKRELGITSDRQDLDDEPGIKVVIPQFYMGDSHVVLLEINVPKGSGSRKVADVHLKYKDLVFKKNQEVTAPVSINYTSSEDASFASIKSAVKKNVLGFQTGEALQKAAMLIERNQPGEAAKAIDEQMVVLGVAAKGWKDPDLDKDGKLLDAYKQVIAGMNTRYAGDQELGDYLAKSLTYSAYQRTR